MCESSASQEIFTHLVNDGRAAGVSTAYLHKIQ